VAEEWKNMKVLLCLKAYRSWIYDVLLRFPVALEAQNLILDWGQAFN